MNRLTMYFMNRNMCNASGEVCGKQRENPKDPNCCCDCEIHQKMIDKLSKYEDAEEQGLLLRLPCKIGETAYEVETQYWIDEKGCKECLCYFNVGDETSCDYPGDCPACTKIVETTFNLTNIDRIGKTLFLTKEEAEAALKKMQESEE